MSCIWILAGCSKSPSPQPPSAQASASTTPAATEPDSSAFPDRPSAVHIDPITAVLPDRPTHLAWSASGLVFVQETDELRDVVDRINEFDLPMPTPLTTLAIATALGQTDIRGNIQALAADGDTLYFYFAGRQKKAFVGCLGRMDSAGKIQILADQTKIAAMSGAGDSLSICRGDLVNSSKILWLWLHGLDGSYFLQIDLRHSDQASEPRRPFDGLEADMVEPDLTHENYTVGAGVNGNLLIVDPWMGSLWSVKPNGFTRQLHVLVAIPKQLASPALYGEHQILLFAAAGDLIEPRKGSEQPESIPYTEFPAFLICRDDGIDTLSRTTFQIPPPFTAVKLQISDLCAQSEPATYTAYDPAQGELFRLRFAGSR